MAIYISGVRNLPEQVQKNKDDIEDLQTADTNLEAKINQEIADRKALIDSGNDTDISVGDSSIVANKDVEIIGGLEAHGNIKGAINLDIDGTITSGGDITATGDITSSGDITSNGDITATGDIKTDNGDIKTDAGNITTASGNIETSLGHVKGLALVSTIINVPDGNHTIQVNCKDTSNTNHVLLFDADTLELTIDGSTIGKQYYEHNICLAYDQSADGYTHIFIQIENEDPTPFTKDSLVDYLYDMGFTTNKKCHIASGWLNKLNSAYLVSGLYAVDKNHDNQSLHLVGVSTTSFNTNSNIQDTNITYTLMGTLTDFVL